MIITDRFVLLNYPRTGSTFVRLALRALHGQADAGPVRRLTPTGSTMARRITGLAVALLLPAVGLSAEPYEPPAPDVEAGLEDLPTGGFGLFFIYQTMDEIGYRTAEDGNHLVFLKRLGTTEQE